MGRAKAAKRQQANVSANNNTNNVVKFNNFLPKKTRNVDILPRNKSQESYILELLNPE